MTAAHPKVERTTVIRGDALHHAIAHNSHYDNQRLGNAARQSEEIA